MKFLSILIVMFVVFFNSFSFVLSVNSGDINKLKESIKEKENQEFTQGREEPEFMRRRKAKKRALVQEIYEKTNISSLMDLNDAAKQLNDISSELKNVNMNYKNIQSQKKSSDKKYQTVLNDAKEIINVLNEKNKELKKKLLSIQIMSKELDNMKNQMQDIDNNIEISKMQIERHVGVLYKINNDYYNALEGLDEIKLLFKSENIAETLSQEDLIQMLSLKTQELLGKLEESRNLKSEFLKKVYVKRAEYIDVVNSYKVEIEVMTEKKKFLLDLLTMLRENKKEIDKLYDNLHKKRTNLARQQIELTKNFFDRRSGEDGTGDIQTKSIDLSSILRLTTKTDGDKFLSWPTKGKQRITAYFNDENYYKRFGWEHDGVDIAVSQGSPIYATAAGYVYYVADFDSDDYNYVVIVHNYGYISIYGHIFKSFVKQGDIVKRGQLIAASGGAKGTRGAGKKSTGAHLHFEVYKNGQLIDPLSALDLSIYRDKSSVPTKRQLKFVKDNLTRKVDLSNLKFFPNNLSHEQRQKIFLMRAAGGFNNLESWKNAGSLYGIDPDVGICIGFAESGLGTNTTTTNNIGNVGNNDRGDRQGYDTPDAGIKAIFYTVNNKYLNKYHTIDQLSRFGNKDSHIFSSSNYNWQKNVVKCLSVIKGHPVDEYYPFRDISKSTRTRLSKFENNGG